MNKDFISVKPNDNDLYDSLEVFTNFKELRFYPDGILIIVTEYIVLPISILNLINNELKKLFNKVVIIIEYNLTEKTLLLFCDNINKEAI